MCRTYNTIGSLTTLKSLLEDNKIYDFKSLKEVIDFQSSFTISRQQLISHHENLIEQEKDMLNEDLQQLDAAIKTQRQQSEQVLTDEIDKLNQQLNILASYIPKKIFQKLSKELRYCYYKIIIK